MTGKDYFATGFSSTDCKIGHCKLVAGKKMELVPIVGLHMAGTLNKIQLQEKGVKSCALNNFLLRKFSWIYEHKDLFKLCSIFNCLFCLHSGYSDDV
jgi:hypothetical protein